MGDDVIKGQLKIKLDALKTMVTSSQDLPDDDKMDLMVEIGNLNSTAEANGSPQALAVVYLGLNSVANRLHKKKENDALVKAHIEACPMRNPANVGPKMTLAYNLLCKPFFCVSLGLVLISGIFSPHFGPVMAKGLEKWAGVQTTDTHTEQRTETHTVKGD